MLVVPHKELGVAPLPDSVGALTAANTAALLDAIGALEPSEIFAVDCGGDAISGGLDYGDGGLECGRDRQVLRALAQSGIPSTLLVLGPGCDAETPIERMQRATADADAAGVLLGTPGA